MVRNIAPYMPIDCFSEPSVANFSSCLCVLVAILFYRLGRLCSLLTCFNCSRSSVKLWLMTSVSLQTAIKFVSPSQRGTRWMCRWSGRPAPAHRPKFIPTLKPCGFITSDRAFCDSRTNFISSNSSSSLDVWRSGMCRRGAISKWPLL